MKAKLEKLSFILVVTLLPTLLVWTPFFANLDSFWSIPLPKVGMAAIVANYDGPLYIVIAKTLYNIPLIKAMFSFPLPVEYYAAHFPLFPLLIKLFSILLGYPYAMLAGTVVSSFIAHFYFYSLIEERTNRENAMWMTILLSFFPARWLIVRSVGSPEPLFLATIIASIYYFQKGKYLLAGIFGALAQLTKSPGILLFASFIMATVAPSVSVYATQGFKGLITHLKINKIYPIVLMPIALVGLFYFYGIRFGNFWAYFNSGDNIHLFFPPFQIFNFKAPWVGTFWLEEVLFVYLLGALGLANLIRQKENIMAWFVGIFLTSILFVSHRDIIRYALPMIPFLFLAFKDTLARKEVRLIILFIAIPSYLFALAFISGNQMPISDWSPLL